jgi:hypothetical protein
LLHNSFSQADKSRDSQASPPPLLKGQAIGVQQFNIPVKLSPLQADYHAGFARGIATAGQYAHRPFRAMPAFLYYILNCLLVPGFPCSGRVRIFRPFRA